MNANRRLQERKLPERIVLCKLGGEESSFVLNLSEDGLGFESHTPIEKTGVLQLRLSAEMDGTIETTGRLAWIDPAKRIGGLRFLELSASAREKIRAWLSENSAASSGPSNARNERALVPKSETQAVDLAAIDMPAPRPLFLDKPVLWQGMRVPSMQLVPIERHRVQKRRHFLGGVFVGFGMCAALVLVTSWFAGGIKLGSLPWASANRAAQSIVQQTHASTIKPASPSAPISAPTATKPLATETGAVQKASVVAPTRSPQNQNQKQSPPSAGVSSTNRMTRTSSPLATSPSTKAERLRASQPAAPAPGDSKTNSSSEQIQHAKKVPPTAQQLWAALQKGNVKAAIALADLYARGEGVSQNCQQARVLLQVAAEKHNAEASKKLQELDKNGCPGNATTE